MSAVLELREVGKTVRRGQLYWWVQIRSWGKNATFTTADLDMSGLDRLDNVRDFIRKLERAGLIECTNADADLKRYDQKIYKILKAPRALPPLKRNGQPGQQGRRQQNMWNTMRSAKAFTKRSLADFASVDGLRIPEMTAASYLKTLKAAGFLITVKEAGWRSPAVYRLDPRRNTGPNPPMILRSSIVYDQNSEELVEPILAEVDA